MKLNFSTDADGGLVWTPLRRIRSVPYHLRVARQIKSNLEHLGVPSDVARKEALFSLSDWHKSYQYRDPTNSLTLDIYADLHDIRRDRVRWVDPETRTQALNGVGDRAYLKALYERLLVELDEAREMSDEDYHTLDSDSTDSEIDAQFERDLVDAADQNTHPSREF